MNENLSYSPLPSGTKATASPGTKVLRMEKNARHRGGTAYIPAERGQGEEERKKRRKGGESGGGVVMMKHARVVDL